MDEFNMKLGNGVMKRLISTLVTRLLKEKLKISSIDICFDKFDMVTRDGKLQIEMNARAYVNPEELTDKIRKGELL